MKELIGVGQNSKTELIRDNHDESGRYYFHTTYYDDAYLERNKRVRLEGLMESNQAVPLDDGKNATVSHAFSIPPDQWGVFCREYPDIVKGLESKDPEECQKAARQMLILHPEWSTMSGNF